MHSVSIFRAHPLQIARFVERAAEAWPVIAVSRELQKPQGALRVETWNDLEERRERDALTRMQLAAGCVPSRQAKVDLAVPSAARVKWEEVRVHMGRLLISSNFTSRLSSSMT